MTKNLRRLESTESQIQCAIIERANVTHYPKGLGFIGEFLIAIKNEGKQKTVIGKNGKKFCPTGQRYNREGRKKGVSDLFLALPWGEYHGLWIEIKKKGVKPTKEQVAWLELMKFAGYEATWRDSVDGVWQAIKDYLEMR